MKTPGVLKVGLFFGLWGPLIGLLVVGVVALPFMPLRHFEPTLAGVAGMVGGVLFFALAAYVVAIIPATLAGLLHGVVLSKLGWILLSGPQRFFIGASWGAISAAICGFAIPPHKPQITVSILGFLAGGICAFVIRGKRYASLSNNAFHPDGPRAAREARRCTRALGLREAKLK
jgi:hypothetical protein